MPTHNASRPQVSNLHISTHPKSSPPISCVRLNHRTNAYPALDRNKDDTADDNDLAAAMIATMDTVKNWAKRGADKIQDSISANPFRGKATKNALEPLIGSDGYAKGAKDVRGRFDSFASIMHLPRAAQATLGRPAS